MGGRDRAAAVTATVTAVLLCLAACSTSSAATSETSSPSSPPTTSTTGRLALSGSQPGEQLSGVLVVDLATDARTRIGGQQEAWSPAWVDGGRRIALVRRAAPDGPGQLVITDPDGSGHDTTVTDTPDVTEVSATPDGQHLVWIGRTAVSVPTCDAGAPQVPLGLYTATGDGAQVHRLADLAPTARAAVPSPDGATIAYLDAGADTGACDSGSTRLVLLDVASGHQRVVTGMTQRAGVPRWSPDGSTIAVDGDDFATGQTRDLVLVDVATASARRLVTSDTIETAPVFSPDGRHLALLRRDAGAGLSSAAVVLADPDGGHPRALARTGTDDQDLAWSPDSTVLAVAGSVVEPLCDETASTTSDAGCDVASAAPGVRIVDIATGTVRQVSDNASLLDAGLTFAP